MRLHFGVYGYLIYLTLLIRRLVLVALIELAARLKRPRPSGYEIANFFEIQQAVGLWV